VDPDYYDSYVDWEESHWWFRGRRRILRAFLDSQLGTDSASTRVLDIGCGTGAMLAFLERYGQVDGIEAEPKAIDHCRRRGFDRVHRVEEPPFPFDDSSFGLVTMLDVLEHIEDDVSTLREARRLLEPDGLLVLTVPAHPRLWGAQDVISHHVRRYRKDQLHSRLQIAGLTVERMSYFNTILFPGIAAVRLWRRRRPSGELRSDFAMTRPGPSNRLLEHLFAAEAPLVAHRDLPFGVSIVAAASRSD
jgi:SAM-dependent methyltransferase